MPTIKMKKGYPTSDGVMHEKHVDAVKAQVGLNMNAALKAATDAEGGKLTDTLRFIEKNSEVVSDYLKYFCIKPKPAAKKKTTTKKPATATGK